MKKVSELKGNECLIKKEYLSGYNDYLYTLYTNSCSSSFYTLQAAKDEAEKYNLQIIEIQ